MPNLDIEWNQTSGRLEYVKPLIHAQNFDPHPLSMASTQFGLQVGILIFQLINDYVLNFETAYNIIHKCIILTRRADDCLPDGQLSARDSRQ